MITFYKYRNERGGTLKYANFSIKFSGDVFFILSKTFINGSIESKSERAFDAVQLYIYINMYSSFLIYVGRIMNLDVYLL